MAFSGVNVCMVVSSHRCGPLTAMVNQPEKPPMLVTSGAFSFAILHIPPVIRARGFLGASRPNLIHARKARTPPSLCQDVRAQTGVRASRALQWQRRTVLKEQPQFAWNVVRVHAACFRRRRGGAGSRSASISALVRRTLPGGSASRSSISSSRSASSTSAIVRSA